MTTRIAFRAAMLAWINERVAPVGMTIQVETPLFGNGLMDSIRVLELIAFTEREIGAVIPDSRIRMDNFRTVGRIADMFVEDAGDAAA